MLHCQLYRYHPLKALPVHGVLPLIIPLRQLIPLLRMQVSVLTTATTDHYRQSLTTLFRHLLMSDHIARCNPCSALPTTSTNGITGTWSPEINNTATTTYTFTPDAGQCATTATLTITITDNIVPAFAAVGPYSATDQAFLTLPATSTNGITGTWSPAINNTTTTTYIFTPDEGQCATTATLTITITDNITPEFTAVGPYLQRGDHSCSSDYFK